MWLGTADRDAGRARRCRDAIARQPRTRGIALPAVLLAIALAAAPPAARAEGPAGADTGSGAAADPCRAAYRVVRGDTLGTIAERAFGRVEDWRRLYDENRAAVGPDPWILEVGTVLAVPCATIGRDPSRPADAGATFARDVAVPALPPSWRAAAGPATVDLGPGVLALVPPAMAARRAAGAEGLQVVDLGPAGSWAAGVASGTACVEAGAWARAAGRGAALGLGALLGRAGLDAARPILLVHGGGEDLADAARVQGLMRAAGLDAVAIMAGTRADWHAAAGSGAGCAARVLAADLPAVRHDGQAAAAPAAAALRLGLAAEGAPACAPGTGDTDPGIAALAAAERLLALDLPWGRAAVALHADDPRAAALARFALAEIAGVPGIAVAPSGESAWRAAEAGAVASAPALPAAATPCPRDASPFARLRAEAALILGDGAAAAAGPRGGEARAAPATLAARPGPAPLPGPGTEGSASGSPASPGRPAATPTPDAPAAGSPGAVRTTLPASAADGGGAGAPVDAAPAPAQPAGTGGEPFLQAGVFTAFGAGRRLVERLSAEGLAAEAIPMRFRGSAALRVRVGPFETLDARQRARARLRALGIRDAFPVAS